MSSPDPESRVLVLVTGGTIGMRPDATGSLRPSKGFVNSWLNNQMHRRRTSANTISHLGRHPRHETPIVVVREYAEPLDSSDMGPADWQRIARDVYEAYNDYDGFVVVVGTDTMAYCASALSFMLENLAKPVICTGAMMPLERGESDARRNLLVSVEIAALDTKVVPLCEVCIFFDNLLLRGVRSKKMNTDGLDAFESPNFVPLAVVGTGITVRRSLLRPMPSPKAKLTVRGEMDERVAVVRLIPGFQSSTVLDALASTSLVAIVLELFGAGTAPKNNSHLVDGVRAAHARGMLVVIASQCPHGWVDLEAYVNGRQLLSAGAVSAGDTTIEALVIKISHLFGIGLSRDAVSSQLKQNLRGELTVQPKGAMEKTRYGHVVRFAEDGSYESRL